MLNNGRFRELLNTHYADNTDYPYHLTQGYVTIKVPIRFRMKPLLPPGSSDADYQAVLYAVADQFVSHTEWELSNIIGEELSHVVRTAYHSGEFDVFPFETAGGVSYMFEIESSYADDPYEVQDVQFDVEIK